MELWDHLIAFLHGSYEDIQGETDLAPRAQATFILKWSGVSMLRLQGGNMQWCYLYRNGSSHRGLPPMRHPPTIPGQ